jgi:hypothetical protein
VPFIICPDYCKVECWWEASSLSAGIRRIKDSGR